MKQEQDIASPMTPLERRASFSLAGIFALRMLGLFMLLPVLSLFAEDLQGSTPFLAGLALSAYGLTQAMFQIPFGILSDRIGRKKVITIGLIIFAGGSLMAGWAENIYGVIAGRALQGSGAIAAAVMALAADLTREVQRTKAMATIGVSIGISFAVAMVTGPVLSAWIGVDGLFFATAVLAMLGIAVVYLLVPNPARSSFHRETEPVPDQIRVALGNPDLLRLDFGILVLHMMLTATFVAVPLMLRDAGLEKQDHWQVYLPVLLVAMVAIVPFIIIAEKKRRMKQVFVGAVSVLAVAQLFLLLFHQSLFSIIAALLLFFCGFNLLEATLPSLISKEAPADLKGTAMGVYSTSQFLGAFLGGVIGGWIHGEFAIHYVFLFGVLSALVWVAVALSMSQPRYLSSLLLPVGILDGPNAALLAAEMNRVPGVAEAVVLAGDGVAYLKVDNTQLDREALQALLPEGSQL